MSSGLAVLGRSTYDDRLYREAVAESAASEAEQPTSLRNRWRRQDTVSQLLTELALAGRPSQAELIRSVLARSGDDLRRSNHLTILGNGADRHGVLPSGSVVPAADDPAPVPGLDNWDF